MQKLKQIIVTLVTAVAIVGYSAMIPAVVSADAASEIRGGVGAVSDGEGTTLADGIKTVVNMMLFILGAISVIMIIIGGFRYVTSNGDSGATQSAKNTILYAVIGLIVAILAFAIVNFVVGAFGGE